MPKTIGLDLSINSTGICVCSGDDVKYYIITCSDKKSKKMLARIDNVNSSSEPLKYYIYKKRVSGSNEYSIKEADKTFNIHQVASYIDLILKEERPDFAFIEGISYGSVGSAALADLSGLNFVARWVLSNNNIPFTIVAPTENKKNACGNGRADKDEMVYAWEHCDDRLKHLKDILKFDDIADAYFLAKTSIENE